MIRISDRTVQGSLSSWKTEFSSRMVEFLLKEFRTAASANPDAIVSGVEVQIERAMSYGFDTERQVAIYVVTAWMLGHDFESKFPQAREALDEEGISSEERARALEQAAVSILRRLSDV